MLCRQSNRVSPPAWQARPRTWKSSCFLSGSGTVTKNGCPAITTLPPTAQGQVGRGSATPVTTGTDFRGQLHSYGTLTDGFLRMLVFYTIVVKMPLNLRRKIKGSAKTPLALLTCRSPQEAGVWGRSNTAHCGGLPGMRAVPAKGSLH